MGAFLSPENLVGRSGNSFPPSSATVFGLYAHRYALQNQNDRSQINLKIAGPFWSKMEDVENFYVPTPFNYLTTLDNEIEKGEVAKKGTITNHLTWDSQRKKWLPYLMSKNKGDDTWIPIKDWNHPKTVWDKPWQYVPHLRAV